MFFIYGVLFLMAGSIWGDWKNWRVYYPTILFCIIGDLLYNFLFFGYPMWTFHETVLGENLLQNHTSIVLLHMLVIYPSTILIFLGRFPRTYGKQVLWIGFWVAIFFTKELIGHPLGLIIHENGWDHWWSLVFDVVMFSILYLHHKRPLFAILLSAIWIIFLWNAHEVPIDILK